MIYHQLHLSRLTTDAEQLGDQLTEAGALSVTFENAEEDSASEIIYEPQPGTAPLWNKTKLTVLFTDEKTLHQALQKIQLENAQLEFRIETLPDQAWERAWMNEFHPLKFGKNTWICPSWCELPCPTAINILLDPGLAFGTGTHPTTALCLEWIDEADCQNKTILDYGCGSGILAIAALLHGAEQVYAIDYDPQALEATQENAIRNKIDFTKLHILKPESFSKTLKFDTILANILAEPLIQLASLFATYLNPKGKIVLSGILNTQIQNILDAYTPYFENFEIKEQEEWVRVEASLK
jgi:ribosomal protein L11 methyltransferase